jgi:uncharacterized membrane protein YphA (DoxX/SURF4 family)
MGVVLWILQGLLALAFLASGAVKVFAYERAREKMKVASVLPRSTALLIGVLELLGAIGLIAPAATGILPWLTPLAAVGLALTMLGAAGFNWTHHQRSHIATNVILLLLAVIVAYGRFVVAPA